MSEAVRFEWPRDIVRVSGSDAESFLQGQLSQDVTAIEVTNPPASAWSLLLQPQGKIDVFLRVTRTAADEFLLDTDAGWGEHMVGRLNRFKLRVKANIEPLPWRCVAFRWEGWAGFTAMAGAVLSRCDWEPFSGVDVFGEHPDLGLDATAIDEVEVERRRILAGFPKMGAELDEDTIPAEAGAGLIQRSVSFSKGCYTGQELVARIDSRGGNVPRQLRLLRVDGAAPAGATLQVGDKAVGRLTSVAPSVEGDHGVGDNGVIALGYVARSVEVPGDVDVQWPGGTAVGHVSPLPD